MHETYNRHPEVILSSDRTFGLVWTALLLIYSVAPIRHGGHLRSFPLTVALVLALISFTVPGLLHLPNRAWARVGVLLHRVFNPAVMAILFFGFFVPIGLFYRCRKKQSVISWHDASLTSYWIKRDPPGPPPESMINQF